MRGASGVIDERLGETVGNDKYKYYTFAKFANNRYTVCITVQSGNADLYGDFEEDPPAEEHQFESNNKGNNKGDNDDCFSFTATIDGPYYISVHGKEAAEFNYWVFESYSLDVPGYLKEALRWPLPGCKEVTYPEYGPFNSPWGNPSEKPFMKDHRNYIHDGVDIECAPGTEVKAACSGKIQTGWLGGPYGWYVLQECEFSNGRVTVAYDHLTEASIKALESKNEVKVDEPIGWVYDMSYPGEKDHLHLGVCTGPLEQCNGVAQRGAEPYDKFNNRMIDPGPQNVGLYNNL